MSKLRVLLLWSFFCLISVTWLATGAQATSYEILNAPSSYGDLEQGDLGENGKYYLGPIAAVNSFVYLENRYHDIYDHSLIPGTKIEAAITLASEDYMKTQLFTGTQVRDFYWGKYYYVEDRVTGKTVYAGETMPTEWTEARPKPSWVAERATGPSWGFIYDQLVNGADVEILLAVSGVGVYLTLTGFHFDDNDDDGIMDSGETAWIRYIDATTGALGQSNIWNNGSGFIECSYEPGCFITMAAAERPVPVPSTLLLFGSGIFGLWGIGRRLTAKRG